MTEFSDAIAALNLSTETALELIERYQQLAIGRTIAPSFAYSTATADADPGAGSFRLNHATLASATAAYVDNLDAAGNTLSTWLDTFDDSTSTVRGHLLLQSVAASDTWALFTVSGPVVDGTGYRKLTLAHLAHGAGAWANAAKFTLNFFRTGDKGDTGATGETGATGATGPAAWQAPAAWATATAYSASDPKSVVTKDGSTYVCATSHTSGVFATDLAAAKWTLIAQAGDMVAAAWVDTDATMAANSDTKVASQKAVKTAIASAVSGILNGVSSAFDTLAEIATELATKIAKPATPAAGDVLAYDGSAWANSPAERIALKNGGFQINQEAPSTNADGTYAHDCWYVLTQSNAIAVSTLTDPEDGQPYAARLTQSNASAQRMGYAQIIESRDIRYLRAKVATMLARLRLSTSANLRAAIVEWTGTADSVTRDIVNNWTSTTYTAGNFFISSNVNVLAVSPSISMTANTWAWMDKLSATHGSSMNNVVVFVWTESTVAQNVTLDIGRASYAQGSIARPYVPISYGEELRMCERYYRAFYCDPAVLFSAFAHGFTNGGGNAFEALVPLRPRMRATPTATISGLEVYDYATQMAATLSNVNYSTPDLLRLTLSISGGTAYRGGLVEAANNTTAFIKASARL